MIVFAFVLFAFVLWLHSSVVVINTSVTLRPETGQRPPGNLWGCQAIANWPLGLCDWGLLHSSEILKKDAQIPSASPKSGGLQEGHTIWNLYWITYSIQACCGTPLENKGAASSTHIIYICHNYSVYLQSDLIQTLCCFFVFLGWVGFTLRLTSSFSCFRTTHCLRNWEWKWTLYSFCFLT